jgi:hypothetical protein
MKPVAFNPYGRRRAAWRPPRWLVLLLSGIAIGVGGVVIVQERYLPLRLSADASAKLRSDYEQADADRVRLKRELDVATQRLNTALADKKKLSDEVAANDATQQQLRADLASVVASLPPDPRGGGVEVRAGRFTVKGGNLDYDIVLTRERGGGKPLAGVMQLVVAGESAAGTESSVNLKPVALTIGSHEVVRGSLPLPAGFKPRQTTVQVLDRVANRPLGMRVLLVK